MTRDLIAELSAALAGSEDSRDLAESLDKIRVKLAEHWAQTYLTWFTDHGVGHAQRVAQRALALGDIPNAPAGIDLSLLERYILCAASLLHDIGMNDLTLSEHPLGEMQPEEYGNVRHGHSRRSGELILAAPTDWGLPTADPVLAEVVGLVARAHGTQYYRPTIPLLEERTNVRDQTVRGPLLAAILLMADELDLSYRRIATIPEDVRLNSVSEAHAFKHRCISSASSHTYRDGTIGLHIRLSIPDELSSDSKVDIERWIVGKLRRQMALIDPQISQGFENSVRFNRAIKVSYVSPLSPRILPSSQALAVIRAEVMTDDLIDHRANLRQARDALSNGHVIITGRWTAETRSDFNGREDLYSALVEGLRGDSAAVVARSGRLHDLGSGEASDILEEWIRDLNREYESPEIEQDSESAARTKLLDACIAAAALTGKDKLLILAASCFDRLSREVIRWFANTAIPRMVQEGIPNLRLLLTADGESPVPTLAAVVTVISTEELDSIEVVDHLKGVGLMEADTLAGSELSYYTLKQICNRKQMNLQAQGS
jgi:hypothetical protein